MSKPPTSSQRNLVTWVPRSRSWLRSWTAKLGQTLDREQRTRPCRSLSSCKAFFFFFYPMIRIVCANTCESLQQKYVNFRESLQLTEPQWSEVCFMWKHKLKGSSLWQLSFQGWLNSNSCPCIHLACFPMEFWLDVLILIHYMVLLLFAKQLMTSIANWTASTGREMCVPLVCKVL